MFHQQKLYDGVYQIWYTLFFASQNKEITRIMNLLDIIGPVMVGPSSSHTAGAVKIGRVCHKLLAEKVVRADIYFHGSFLATGKGHGTDKAVVAGLLGMQVDDPADCSGYRATLTRSIPEGKSWWISILHQSLPWRMPSGWTCRHRSTRQSVR